MTMTRTWCAIAQYDGKKPFHIGTVVADAGATMHEVESLMLRLFDELLPVRPVIRDLQPGVMQFVPEGEQ